MKTIERNLIPQKEENSFVSRISNIISSIGFISEKDRAYSLADHISYLLKASENSDAKIKSKIENHIVKLGKKAVPALVESLFETDGPTRGMVAMILIRIGTPSITYLEQAVKNNPELNWISDYIIREIEGSQIKVGSYFKDNSLEAVLVG